LLAALQLLLLALDFIPASLPVSGLQLHIPPSGLGLLQDGFRLSFGLRQKDVRA